MKSNPYYTKWFILLIIIFTLVSSYFPLLFTGFLNDDFQILLWHNPENLFECFSPLWNIDISQDYWRPLPNIMHSLTNYLFGFNSFWFRLENLILLFLSCYIFYLLLVELKVEKSSSLLASIFCFILPAKQIVASWIAARGDAMVLLFILLSALYYLRYLKRNTLKNTLFSIIFFIAALLSKEHSFAAVLLPLIFSIVYNNKVQVYIALKTSGLCIVLLLITFIYRFGIINSNPFSSSHFQNSGLFEYIGNFLIYILISFFPPEYFEFVSHIKLVNGLELFQTIIILLFFGSMTIFIIILYIKKKEFTTFKLLLIGLLWYLLMILPVLPQLMRWYPYVASISIGFMLANILSIQNKNIKSNLVKFLIISILFFFILNHINSINWYSASKKVEQIGEKAYLLNDNIQNEIYVWAIPDRLNNAPVLKLGFRQAMEYFGSVFTNNELFSYLRIEAYTNHSIEYKINNENEIIFYGKNLRFTTIGSRSQAITKKEEIIKDFDECQISIKTDIKDGIMESVATIKLKRAIKETQHFYYNGITLQKIEK